MNRNAVFVYGTLRRGASNHFRMKGSEWIGTGAISGEIYEICLNPEFLYPALNTKQSGEWSGDVFMVSDEVLAELDGFEGISEDSSEADEYRRIEIPVKLDSGIGTLVHAWEWNRPLEDGRLLESGDWLFYEQNPS